MVLWSSNKINLPKHTYQKEVKVKPNCSTTHTKVKCQPLEIPRVKKTNLKHCRLHSKVLLTLQDISNTAAAQCTYSSIMYRIRKGTKKTRRKSKVLPRKNSLSTKKSIKRHVQRKRDKEKLNFNVSNETVQFVLHKNNNLAQ